MDRNSLTGFILICLLSLAYFWYMSPSEEEIEREKQRLDSIALVQKGNENVVKDAQPANNAINPIEQGQQPQVTDSTKVADAYGGYFKKAATGAESITTLQNDLIKIDFSNKGGRVKKVELNNFKTSDKREEKHLQPLILTDEQYDKFGYEFFIGNYLINTNNLFFEAENKGNNSISYKAYADDNSYIEQTFTLQDGSYMIDYDLNLVGMDDVLPRNLSYINLKWKALLKKQEKLRKSEMPMTSIYRGDAEKEVDHCDCNKTDEESLQSNIKWVGFVQQFFNQAIIADEYFLGGKLDITVPENDKLIDTLKYASAELNIPYQHQPEMTFPMRLYYGPNDFQILKSYDIGMQEVIPLGGSVFRWFNQWLIIPLFNFFDNYIASYGIIILILTLLIKGMLFPLTYKTYQSAAKMNLLKPDIAAINEKHKKDKQKAQMETMQLYRKAGVNPAGGCLPTLLQMPILFAMYRFFPSSIELRQQGFLWADDLSTYDSILDLGFNIPLYGDHISLFTLLMSLSTFLYMRVNQQMTPTTNEAMAAQMKIMQNIMPIMFLGIFNNFASGLTYYFFLSNLTTYAQQFVIKRFFIDEDKLKKQIASNKVKVRKKSKFQQRLEEIQKQSEQIQRERQKKQKRK